MEEEKTEDRSQEPGARREVEEYVRRFRERQILGLANANRMGMCEPVPAQKHVPRLPREGDGVNFDGAVYRVVRVKKGKVLLKYWKELGQ